MGIILRSKNHSGKICYFFRFFFIFPGRSVTCHHSIAFVTECGKWRCLLFTLLILTARMNVFVACLSLCGSSGGSFFLYLCYPSFVMEITARFLMYSRKNNERKKILFHLKSRNPVICLALLLWLCAFCLASGGPNRSDGDKNQRTQFTFRMCCVSVWLKII